MSWRERLHREPGLGDLASWPVIDVASLPANRRRGFVANQRIVAAVLTHGSCTRAAHDCGCSKGYVSQLMTRCLGGDLEQPAALTVALIPHVRLVRYQRVVALPLLSAPTGVAGAFQGLLGQLPEVKQGLDDAIRADYRRSPLRQCLTASGLHQEFLRLLAEAHWPRSGYPFTSVSRGYESIRRYLNDQRGRLTTRQAQRPAYTESAVGTPGPWALATVQIDEHLMHLVTNLAIRVNGELVALRLQRCTLLLAVDVASECILGFVLQPTRAPNQDDLQALFDHCLTPRPPPRILTPGFDALTVPATPVHAGLERPIAFGTVQFDNAWIHHSRVVEDFLCDRMGGTLSFGKPGNPLTRALVEHVFAYLEQKLGYRFDSTTGNHPTDPRRESRKNQARVPALSYQSLIEAIWLQVARYNHSPRPHLAGEAPMERFQRQLREHWVRWVPGGVGTGWAPFRWSHTVPVHRPATEQRRPYVQFCYCRYSGDGLLTLAPGDTRVVIECDRRDIRTVTARTLEGRPLGTLRAPRTWLRFPHSRATRSWLFRTQRVARYEDTDPITGLFLEWLGQRPTPSIAAHILDLYQETTWSGQTELLVGESARIACAESEGDPVAAPQDGATHSSFTWSPTPLRGPRRL